MYRGVAEWVTYQFLPMFRRPLGGEFRSPNAPGGELMVLWLNIATLLGWLLSSIFVLSLTRLSRSS